MTTCTCGQERPSGCFELRIRGDPSQSGNDLIKMLALARELVAKGRDLDPEPRFLLAEPHLFLADITFS